MGRQEINQLRRQLRVLFSLLVLRVGRQNGRDKADALNINRLRVISVVVHGGLLLHHLRLLRLHLDECHVLVVTLHHHSLQVRDWHRDLSGLKVSVLRGRGEGSSRSDSGAGRDVTALDSQRDLLLVSGTDGFLVDFDGNPALALDTSVFAVLARLSDFFVFLNLVQVIDRIGGRDWPDRVVAPAAATLDEQTTAVGVRNGKKRVLVAEGACKEEAEDIVVDVNVTALRGNTLGIEPHTADNDSTSDEVRDKAVALLEHLVGVVE